MVTTCFPQRTWQLLKSIYSTLVSGCTDAIYVWALLDHKLDFEVKLINISVYGKINFKTRWQTILLVEWEESGIVSLKSFILEYPHKDFSWLQADSSCPIHNSRTYSKTWNTWKDSLYQMFYLIQRNLLFWWNPFLKPTLYCGHFKNWR